MAAQINRPRSQLARQISSIPFAYMLSLMIRLPAKNGKTRKENAT
jgi:hypothetical protein